MHATAKRGFTLIELLVVIVIIGILAGGLFLMVGAGKNKSAVASTTARVHAIATLLEEYKAIYGNYPRVSSADDKGYAPLDFHFVAAEGSPGCKSCGFKAISESAGNDGDEIKFGLCSHFIPRAATIIASSDDALQDHYNRMYESPAEDTAWETEIHGLKGNNKALETTRLSEAADPNLQQIYLVWRRLEKQGIVYSGVSGCDDCDAQRYTAGANVDAWGRALKYRNEGGAGEILSAGPDGTFGTADDVTASGAASEQDSDEQFIADDEDE